MIIATVTLIPIINTIVITAAQAQETRAQEVQAAEELQAAQQVQTALEVHVQEGVA